MENIGILGHYGAGPYHAGGDWREANIQKYYRENKLIHATNVTPIVQDNGAFAIRDMNNEGVWIHRTDTKQLWCITPPLFKNEIYPKLSQEEFIIASNGQWPDGKIPEVELKDSFHCWDTAMIVEMQDDYIKDLRRRFKEKL